MAMHICEVSSNLARMFGVLVILEARVSSFEDK